MLCNNAQSVWLGWFFEYIVIAFFPGIVEGYFSARWLAQPVGPQKRETGNGSTGVQAFPRGLWEDSAAFPETRLKNRVSFQCTLKTEYEHYLGALQCFSLRNSISISQEHTFVKAGVLLHGKPP